VTYSITRYEQHEFREDKQQESRCSPLIHSRRLVYYLLYIRIDEIIFLNFREEKKYAKSKYDLGAKSLS